MARKTKPEIVIAHLKKLGRITDATARAAHGSFSLAHAIFRLRTDVRHLIPRGKKIETFMRHDVMGNPFAEYRLVDAKKDEPAFPSPAFTPAFLETSAHA